MKPLPPEILTELIETRRDFHAHPEIGFEEVRTAGIVADRLRALGIEVRTGVAKTGVVGLLRCGAPGPTVMLRADMDCLPDKLRGRRYYHPTQEGVEKRIAERLAEIKKRRSRAKKQDSEEQ